MNESVLEQLHELAQAFNKIGLQPVICGGLGIYLRFSGREHEIELRATNDIDLMVTKTQAQSESGRRAILRTIKDNLKYVFRADGQCFMFEKPPNKILDVLAPPIAGLTRKNDFRVRLVRSQLHGRLTPEACFIEEGLEIITIGDVSIQIPSLANQLILKLFAFDDRHNEGETERAQTHANDIFIITELSNRSDYLRGREFISSHKDSEIICKARDIVSKSFYEPENDGWQYVLNTKIYPELSVKQRVQKLEHAARRLKRWFKSS